MIIKVVLNNGYTATFSDILPYGKDPYDVILEAMKNKTTIINFELKNRSLCLRVDEIVFVEKSYE